MIRTLFGKATQRTYRERGYSVFRAALPIEHVDAVARLINDLLVPYEGSLLRQDGREAPHEFAAGTKLVMNALANAHMPISEPMRPLERALTDLITSPQLGALLHELDGAQDYTIHQTLLFFVAQTTQLHVDSWGLDTSPRGFAHTLWIPLQDMSVQSGLPAVIPWRLGSALSEEELSLPPTGSPKERYERYHEAFTAKLMSGSPEVVTAVVCKGDLCVWSSLTPHLTMPSSPAPRARLSLQVLLRPTHLRWGNFIDQPEDHPTNRHIRINERFSYFVSEGISRKHQIAGGLPEPAA